MEHAKFDSEPTPASASVTPPRQSFETYTRDAAVIRNLADDCGQLAVPLYPARR